MLGLAVALALDLKKASVRDTYPASARFGYGLQRADAVRVPGEELQSDRPQTPLTLIPE